MAKASVSFGRLRRRLWNNHHTSMRVNGKIYRAIVLSTLLYEPEAWTMYRRQVKKLHAFMMRHLRSTMGITWMGKVTNKDIIERTGLTSMGDLLTRKNLRWTGLDVTRQATKADSLLSTVFRSQKEEEHSSPIQGYHQEKPEAERHNDQLMDITLIASQVMDADFVASRPTARC